MRQIVFIIMALCLAFFFSCKKADDSTPPPVPAALTASPATLTFKGYAGGIDSFTVTYDGKWSVSIVSSNASWLKLSSDNGSGNKKIYVTVEQANTSGTDKTATIEVKPEGATTQKATITVTQQFFNFTASHRVYGGTETDEFNKAIPATDGGYIAVGTTKSTGGDISKNHGIRDVWVVKTNADGTKLWEKTYGGAGDDFGYSIVSSPDGGYLIAGTTGSTDGDVTGNHGQFDVWLIKIDGNGTIAWQKTYGGSRLEDAWSLIATTDGGYLVAAVANSSDGDVSGYHNPSSPSTIYLSDTWLLKVDANGVIVWQKCYGSTDEELGIAVTESPDGYAVIGHTDAKQANGDITTAYGGYDVWLFKVNKAGVMQWQKSLGGTKNDVGRIIENTNDGGYIIGTNTVSPELGYRVGASDAWIVKLDGTGNKIWEKTLGGKYYDDPIAIIATVAGDYIVGGSSSSPDGDLTGNIGGMDGWIFKLSNSGTLEWQKNCGGTEYDQINSMVYLGNNNYLVAGRSSSNDHDITGQHGQGDAWLMTFNAQ
ncbi:MAG: BACON domain-containing protein [Chitinophagaceae bacterium]